MMPKGFNTQETLYRGYKIGFSLNKINRVFNMEGYGQDICAALRI